MDIIVETAGVWSQNSNHPRTQNKSKAKGQVNERTIFLGF